MGPSICLFSCISPGHTAPKKVRGFLSLPGEVRNQIYQCYFEPNFRCEIAAKGSHFEEHKTQPVKLWPGAFRTGLPILKRVSEAEKENPVTIRVSRRLGQYNIIEGLQTNWFASLFALNLVCKQVHGETLPFLYHRTLFVFDSSNRLTNFLQVISSSKLHHITRLQFHYTTYGCPHVSEDCIWQDKHNKSWIRACTAASKKLVGLRELKIKILLHDNPPRFSLRESWVLPLLQFRRLGQTVMLEPKHSALATPARQRRNMKIVDVDLRTKWSGWSFGGNQELAEASDALHRLFSGAICSAILGANEEAAMVIFNKPWNEEYEMWQFHLGFANTGW